jgi:hypothetical protein
MSEENVLTVRRVFAAVESRDLTGVLANAARVQRRQDRHAAPGESTILDRRTERWQKRGLWHLKANYLCYP